MTGRSGILSERAVRVRAALHPAILLIGLGLCAPATAQVNNLCDQPGEAPDLITGDIVGGAYRWGNIGGITGYSIGTEICNVGTCWLNFSGTTASHPIVGQNLFRLRAGRFEQIGQSWVKHPGGALQDMGCSTSCLPAPDGTHLGVNCSDIYLSEVNGRQNNMGPKSDINPYTGVFVYPFTTRGLGGDAIYKRLQVHDTDLDPNLNGGAYFFFEAQHIAADDSAAGNGANNCSYQRAHLSVSNGVFNLQPGGETQIGKAAIQAWKAFDPSVTETFVSLPSNGTYIVDSKATFLGAGFWHYEYAVQNVNASRGEGKFTVPVPAGAHVSNLGFHDVDYHSGDSHDGAAWNGSAASGSVSWGAPYSDELSFNALSWGTLYNFRFDADVAPGSRQVIMAQFESHPGDPTLFTVAANAVTPSRCDGDGVCDPGEDCTSCPGDCATQGGGTGCCGDGVCSPGESALACFADCGIASSSEIQCADSVDNDRDGLVDCFDPDCCADIGCGMFDQDGDFYIAGCDCDDTNRQFWATPGEIPYLEFAGPTLYWAPTTGGMNQYNVLRSNTPADFTTSAVCLDTYLNSANDPENPSSGGVFAYLVRAVNGCPEGVGSLGTDSAGHPRVGRTCP